MPDSHKSPLLFVSRINKGGWVISGGNAFRERGFYGLVKELPVNKLTVMAENCYQIELAGIGSGKSFEWIFIALDENIFIINDWTIEIRFLRGVELRFVNHNIGADTVVDLLYEDAKEADIKKEVANIRYAPTVPPRVIEMSKVEQIKEAPVANSPIVRGQDLDYDERREIAQSFAKFHKMSLGERGWFTLRDYVKFLECESLKPKEREFIEYLVGWGGLSYKEDIYTLTDKFAGLLEKFAKGAGA